MNSLTNLRDSLENCLRLNSGFEGFINRTNQEMISLNSNQETFILRPKFYGTE